MAPIDPLLERNRHFAATTAREGVSIVAKHPVYVITCLNPPHKPVGVPRAPGSGTRW